MITATLYNDPGCPWAYSERPALRVLSWRYGAQLSWRLVMIGLTEDAQQYVDRGYTPLRGALGQLAFRRYGMPYAPAPKARVAATSPGCRVVVAARLRAPGSEWPVFEALQLANFIGGLLLDDVDGIRAALEPVPDIDPSGLVAAIEDPDVIQAYERDRAEARAAAGTAAELQGKTAATDGPVRFTAPTVVFEHGDLRLTAGGFQPVEAYDVLVANLDPRLDRRPPPAGPLPLLEHFPHGLTTQEVAALLVAGNEAPDRTAAEASLLELVAAGAARRVPAGDDALWLTAS
jgi:protein-disulfide isomerase-like protein with CxxC motif